MSAPTDGGQVEIPCEDFLMFQDSLKKWRLIDDRLIYALNVSLPTSSFSNKVNRTDQCKDLYGELTKTYNEREKSIKTCINRVAAIVQDLQKQKIQHPDNPEIIRHFGTEQRKLRLMQSEMNVEEVLRDRSFKVFHERCRNYYTPPSKPIL